LPGSRNSEKAGRGARVSKRKNLAGVLAVGLGVFVQAKKSAGGGRPGRGGVQSDRFMPFQFQS